MCCVRSRKNRIWKPTNGHVRPSPQNLDQPPETPSWFTLPVRSTVLHLCTPAFGFGEEHINTPVASSSLSRCAPNAHGTRPWVFVSHISRPLVSIFVYTMSCCNPFMASCRCLSILAGSFSVAFFLNWKRQERREERGGHQSNAQGGACAAWNSYR